MMAGISLLHGRRGFTVVCSLVIILVAWAVAFPLMRQYPPSVTRSQSPELGKLPLAFESSGTQNSSAERFLVRSRGAAVLFTPSEITMSLRREGAPRTGKDSFALPASISPGIDGSVDTDVVQLRFLGANENLRLTGGTSLPGKVSYFSGNDPSTWRTNLSTYSDIRYDDLYPGIDLAYSGATGQLKGTYTVAPGADPNLIRWQYSGATSVSVNSAGDLQVGVSGADGGIATVSEQAPIAWQEIDGERSFVQARYHVAGDSTIGFSLGSYNSAYPLVIDPYLTYSTYLGGIGNDWGNGIAVDAEGNIYVTGWTASVDFPLANPYQPVIGGSFDVFISKFNPSGSALIYSTYLGGNGSDQALRITVDGKGNAYLTGRTGSTNFPIMNAFQATFGGGTQDVFVAKLGASGSALAYSTYLGGNGDDEAYDVEIDVTGSAYVVGNTASSNFPLANPFQPILRGARDAFITKLAPSGSKLAYSTYLGGSAAEGGYGVAVASDGSNAYASGITLSSDFPVASPYQPTNRGGGGDAFVTKFTTSGSGLVYSSYFGGTLRDVGGDLTVDASGNLYHTGTTSSFDFPVANALQATNGGGSDAFITKLSPTGTTLLYSTYLGGSGDEIGSTCKLDSEGNLYTTGGTRSTNFPAFNAIQSTLGGGQDAYVTKQNAPGSVLSYATYLGGSGDDFGRLITVDGAGVVYVTGETYSTDFPLVNPYQPVSRGNGDVYVSRIGYQPPPVPTTNPKAHTATLTSVPTAVAVPCSSDMVTKFHQASRIMRVYASVIMFVIVSYP